MAQDLMSTRTVGAIPNMLLRIFLGIWIWK